jgi:hypothetical protein
VAVVPAALLLKEYRLRAAGEEVSTGLARQIEFEAHRRFHEVEPEKPERPQARVVPPRRNARRKSHGPLKRIRKISIERLSKEELSLHREVRVGAANPATYRIALRLLRRSLPVEEVAQRLGLPRNEVREIQEIYWRREAREKDQQMASEQVSALLSELLIERVVDTPAREPEPYHHVVKKREVRLGEIDIERSQLLL